MPLLLPFFKFDVQAWLTSETVSLMMNEQRGAFITLLAKCWATVTCTLPNDRGLVEQLAEWKGSEEQFERVWGCFAPDRKQPTRLINRRLLKEWKAAKARQAFYAERARAGADARWADKSPPQRAKPIRATSSQDWLAELRAHPLYAHVNWERELGKMQIWNAAPENKHRKITRKFVVSWVNKIEPPILNGGVSGKSLHCAICQKDYANPGALKTHNFLYHPKYEG